MWFSFSKADNSLQVRGLTERRQGQRILFDANADAPLHHIDELQNSEYQQAVEFDTLQRQVRFGRDYLGQYPLYYACLQDAIAISDDIGDLQDWLTRRKQSLTLSRTAIALYLSMGYIPQGYTLYNEIHACRNTTLYQWQDGQLSHSDLFKPIEVDTAISLEDVDAALDFEISKIFNDGKPVDVWCSGGLDSSIIAMLCNEKGRKADLVTLQHVAEFKDKFGDGELPFALELQQQLQTSLHEVEFSPLTFNNSYYDFLSLHPTPVLDPVVTPKYMLARKTRELAVTGEGGDPVFGGVKNNTVCYMHMKNPGLSPGLIYALAHQRFHALLPQILSDGLELQTVVNDYLQDLWEKYPGSIQRKLFYMNTFEKQGGMIFPKNYYAGKYGGISARHPLASLGVYRTAFALDDGLKYRYPDGKLALIELYGNRMPVSIMQRKKSGTLVPMDAFLRHIHSGVLDFAVLEQSGLFNEVFLSDLSKRDLSQFDNCNVFLVYALLTLTKWLESNGGKQNATSNVSLGTGNL